MKRSCHSDVILFLLFLINPLNLLSQDTAYPVGYFRSPVDFPMILSGSFAELRNNHFHSGIDITTQKEVGKNIYACADGYVSRIKISPFGYGKALYIDHPNGYTTVYAHLDGFNTEIGNWVRSEQYRLERFDVDLFPPKGLLSVKKGEIVGLSGNSGTSDGPHIHFEVRETVTEKPVDPILFGFPVKDFIRPVINSVVIYPEGQGSTVNGKNASLKPEIAGWGPVYRLRDNDTLTVSGQFSLGLQCSDLQNGSKNKNGICRYSVYVDSVLRFEWKATSFSFAETRYINSFIDYKAYQQEGERFIRTKIDENNKLSMYTLSEGRGIFYASPDSLHHIRIVVADANKNESIMTFLMKGHFSLPDKDLPVSGEPLLDCTKKNEFTKDGITIRFSENCLYENIRFDFKATGKLANTLSKVFYIHNPGVPLHDPAELIVDVDPEVRHLSDKLTLALLQPGKKPASVGGTYEKGLFITRIREFGQYALMADTIIPVIKPLNISNGKDISSQRTIRISIGDDFSGIRSYRATLNDKWILMDFDPKNKLLEYRFDERIQQGQNLFVLKIDDHCGNSNIFEATLLYNSR